MNYFDAIPEAARPDCASCPFAVDGAPMHKPVEGVVCDGIVDKEQHKPRAVLVGEGPGNEEVRQSKPFVGKTGKELDKDLENAGIRRSDLVLLNAMACLPPKVKSDSMLGKATKACQAFFQYQREPYKHLPTLAAGKWAGAAVNNGKAITVDTGRGFVRLVHGTSLIVTWHPTYAHFYNPWKLGEFINDMMRFKRMIEGRLEKPPLIYIQPHFTYDNLRTALAERSKQTLACDIETGPAVGHPDSSGKNPLLARLKTISVGWPDLAYAYLWNSDMRIQKLIVHSLEDAKVLKVFHNGYFFDLRVLSRYDIAVANVRDTRDMRRAVSATSRLSLRFLTSVHTDFEPWKENDDDK